MKLTYIVKLWLKCSNILSKTFGLKCSNILSKTVGVRRRIRNSFVDDEAIEEGEYEILFFVVLLSPNFCSP